MVSAAIEHGGRKPDCRLVTGLCPGTSLRTPFGARRVEMINAGDLVVTRDKGLQPVRMVWTRTVTQEEMRERPELAPVRLRPRAIGPLMPARDLCIAPGHRALIPGYRIADVPDDRSYLMRIEGVAALNDAAFVDRSAERVTYYNLVFDSHHVFCAEGLPVESFRPSPGAVRALDPGTREQLEELFPPLAKKRCAYPAVTHPVAGTQAFLADAV